MFEHLCSTPHFLPVPPFQWHMLDRDPVPGAETKSSPLGERDRQQELRSCQGVSKGRPASCESLLAPAACPRSRGPWARAFASLPIQMLLPFCSPEAGGSNWPQHSSMRLVRLVRALLDCTRCLSSDSC